MDSVWCWCLRAWCCNWGILSNNDNIDVDRSQNDAHARWTLIQYGKATATVADRTSLYGKVLAPLVHCWMRNTPRRPTASREAAQGVRKSFNGAGKQCQNFINALSTWFTNVLPHSIVQEHRVCSITAPGSAVLRAVLLQYNEGA